MFHFFCATLYICSHRLMYSEPNSAEYVAVRTEPFSQCIDQTSNPARAPGVILDALYACHQGRIMA